MFCVTTRKNKQGSCYPCVCCTVFSICGMAGGTAIIDDLLCYISYKLDVMPSDELIISLRQWNYLDALTEVRPTKRSVNCEPAKTKFTKYYLKNKGEKVQVCQKMFCNTFHISRFKTNRLGDLKLKQRNASQLKRPIKDRKGPAIQR